MYLWHVGYEFRPDGDLGKFTVGLWLIPAINRRQALDYVFDRLHSKGFETRFPLTRFALGLETGRFSGVDTFHVDRPIPTL